MSQKYVMARILCIHNEQCELIEDQESFDRFGFHLELHTSELILYKNKKYTLSNHEFIKVEDTIFGYDAMQKETWSCIEFQDKTTFGRSKYCTISFASKHISKIHFLIERNKEEFLLKDQGSTNGTFVNGKKTKEVLLKPGDQIVFADVILYCIPPYGFINRSKDGIEKIPATRFCPFEKMESHPRFDILPITCQTMEIEGPDFLEPPKKTSIFDSFGSSFMILLSSCFSGLVLYFVSNVEISMIFTMMFSSLSMGLSFFFGLIHRHFDYKHRCLTYTTQNQLYLKYLEEQKVKCDSLKKEIQQQIHSLYSLCTTFHKETYGSLNELTIFLGYQNEQVLAIHGPKPSYRNKEHLLRKYQAEFIKEVSKPVKIPIFLKSGDHVWLKQDFNERLGNALFSQLLWQNAGKMFKVILVSRNTEKIRPFMDLDCVIIDKYRLIYNENTCSWFKKQKVLRSYNLLFFVLEPDLLTKIDTTQTILYIHTQETGFSFDKILCSTDLYCIDFAFKRQAIYLNQKKNKIPFPFLKEPKIKGKVELNVPIGLMEDGQLFTIDFSQSGQGPHALIAGTTGSGKSEWLTTVLMMLIYHNHSKYLQYILIDFKGEALGRSFVEFPHCAGLVSNLEKNDMVRFCASMDHEIKKRQVKIQKLLSIKSDATADIDSYNELFPDDPLSHLFIIVDEFAQLKTKYPEYMKSIIEFARIGRSLGFHLLLSTQKPMGIVDEQILSNMNCKICLRVNSIQDSRELLQNDLAFKLKKPGSFILQANQGGIQKGEAFYLRNPIEKENTMRIVSTKDEILYSDNNNQPSIFEYITSRVMNRKEDRNWILYPDLKTIKDFDWGLFLVDMPSVQKQVVRELDQNLFVLTQEPKKIIEALLKRYSMQPIYLYGCSSYIAYVDEVFTDRDLLEKLEKIPKHALFIGVVTELPKFMIHCRTVWIFDRCQQPVLAGNKLVYDCLDVESTRIFLDTYSIHENFKDPVLQIDGHLYACLIYQCGTLMKKTKKQRIAINHDKEIYLGYNLQSKEDVYHPLNRKLVVLYVQKSVRSFIDLLFQMYGDIKISEELTENAQITICNVLTMDTLYFESIQYDVDLLWVGLGYQEYGYFIKRRVDMYVPCKMIYFHEEKSVCIKGEL